MACRFMDRRWTDVVTSRQGTDSTMPNRPEIVLGFLPLLDSAILIAALEKGFCR